MKTSITISLLPSSPKMPFVLGPDLPSAVETATALGFDAFELFPPTLEAIDEQPIASLCQQNGINLSTVGTGGGAVSQGLTLTDPDESKRAAAVDYVKGVIQRAGEHGAAAIIGSMQGRIGDRDRRPVMDQFSQTLSQLADYAQSFGQPLLLEPLNRYESDVLNRVCETADFFDSIESDNLLILADLFHMNIEEVCIASAIKKIRNKLGHLHFVDSNRWPAGQGHTDLKQIADALIEIDYDRFLAVEAFPLPDQTTAAQTAMDAFREFNLCGATT